MKLKKIGILATLLFKTDKNNM